MTGLAIAGIAVGCWFILAGIFGTLLGRIVADAERREVFDIDPNPTEEFPAIPDDAA